MDRLPRAVIIVDPRIEINAIREARRLNIPVFGIVDTNCDPDDVDFVIPGNDDAVRSVKVVLGVLANAVCEANGLPTEDYVSEENTAKAKNAAKEEVEVVNKVIEEKPVAKIEEVKVEAVTETTEEVKEEKKEKKASKKKEETVDLESLSVAELKKMAKEKEIKGYSTMKKDELIASLK
jgi:small subunit ribosomal protein S2